MKKILKKILKITLYAFLGLITIGFIATIFEKDEKDKKEISKVEKDKSIIEDDPLLSEIKKSFFYKKNPCSLITHEGKRLGNKNLFLYCKKEGSMYIYRDDKVRYGRKLSMKRQSKNIGGIVWRGYKKEITKENHLKQCLTFKNGSSKVGCILEAHDKEDKDLFITSCKYPLEKLAYIDYKWDYSNLIKYWNFNKKNKSIIFTGSGLKFKNAFNVWIPKRYKCSFHYKTLEPLNYEVY